MQPPSNKPVKLVRTRLDARGVELHLRELVARADAIEIRSKGGSTVTSEPNDLETATRQLLAGEVTAVQLRFREHDEWWVDTLLRAGDDYRLVRMREGG